MLVQVLRIHVTCRNVIGMTTTTAPAFTHTLPCEERRMGQAVLTLIESGLDVIGVDQIIATYETHRPACDCATDALRKVEADLTLARKRERAYRNSAAFGSAEYSVIAREVEDLIARRTAIREAIG